MPMGILPSATLTLNPYVQPVPGGPGISNEMIAN